MKSKQLLHSIVFIPNQKILLFLHRKFIGEGIENVSKKTIDNSGSKCIFEDHSQ